MKITCRNCVLCHVTFGLLRHNTGRTAGGSNLWDTSAHFLKRRDRCRTRRFHVCQIPSSLYKGDGVSLKSELGIGKGEQSISIPLNDPT